MQIVRPACAAIMLAVAAIASSNVDAAHSAQARAPQCARSDLRASQYGTTGAAAGTLGQGFVIRSRRRCRLHGLQRITILGPDGKRLRLSARATRRRRATATPRNPLFFDLYYHNPLIPEGAKTVVGRYLRLKLYGIRETFLVDIDRRDFLVGDSLFTSGLGHRP